MGNLTRADMEVDKVADTMANMEVHKVADMVADMSCFNLVRELVAGVGLLGLNFFRPEAYVYPTCVSSKLCEFII